MGPAGCRKKEKALTLAEEFNYITVSVGDLLEREISKKSELGKKIKEAQAKFLYGILISNRIVDDSIVIELVNQQIKELESEGKNYVIEGYPRTRVQAKSLQRMGVVPDKFFILNTDDDTIYNKLRASVMSNNTGKNAYNEDIDAIVQRANLEYKINIEDVKEVFAGLYCETDSNQDHDAVVNDIARIIKLRGRSNAPKRPPRVLIVGAPGSGKTTLGKLIAKKFKLVYVSSADLLKGEIISKTAMGKVASQLIREGELVPDDIVVELIEHRLNQQDCKVNGWVLEGFPKTENQMNALKLRKMSVSLMVVLQIDDDIVYERHEYKKIDPVTGKTYNLRCLTEEVDGLILERLVSKGSDKHEIVKKRLRAWKEFLPKLEEAFKEHRLSLNADKSIESLAAFISEAIENSIN